jgi:hypothetical protein
MTLKLQPSKSDRFERKFLVSELTRCEIETIVKLHPAMFHEVYPPRSVNNLYLDSYDARNYFATIDGLSERAKVRIRWYGELFGLIEKPVLEIKAKTGTIGRKISHQLLPFMLNETFESERLSEVFLKSEIPDDLRLFLMSLRVLLLNCYHREYFQSADRRYRLTIDSDMEFYRIHAFGNTFHAKSADKSSIVVELKYSCENQEDAEHVSNYFPFRMTKSSKYVSGIERLLY